MTDVAVIGVGMTSFGKYPEQALADLGWPAVRQALGDAGVDAGHIQACFAGSGYGGPMVGQRVLARLGMTGIPIVNVENACSSGSTALRQAVAAIRSGMHEVVLAIGIDKLSKFGGGTIPLEQDDWEARNGMSMPAVYAMRARRYMHEWGARPEQFGMVSVKNRANGARNPDAQMRKPVSLEEVMSSRMVADPFTLLQCCPTGDGAAAAILCSAEIARRVGARPIWLRASHLSSGRFTLEQRDITSPEITVLGAAHAYEEAGIGPSEIDVAEVHDAFSCAEIFYYEAFGFCPRGEGAHYVEQGKSAIGGDGVAVNPSGGLLSKGHPIGATGLAQVVEVVRQLRGDCGARQVERCRVGLTHATGGGLTGFDHGACSIHIFSV